MAAGRCCLQVRPQLLSPISFCPSIECAFCQDLPRSSGQQTSSLRRGADTTKRNIRILMNANGLKQKDRTRPDIKPVFLVWSRQKGETRGPLTAPETQRDCHYFFSASQYLAHGMDAWNAMNQISTRGPLVNIFKADPALVHILCVQVYCHILIAQHTRGNFVIHVPLMIRRSLQKFRCQMPIACMRVSLLGFDRDLQRAPRSTLPRP